MKADLGHGINLGGWLSQAPGDEEHRQTYVKEADVRRIADWGFRNIRLPFDYPLICPGEDIGSLQESGLVWLDTGIDWAENAGLKVVLDMHQLPGYTFMDPVNNPDATPPLFTDGDQQDYFFDLWRSLAKRYLGLYPNMVFELANEIAAPTGAQWNDLAARAVKVVREIDPERPIIIGSNCWNVCGTYTEMAAVDDTNIIYNFHFYNPFTFTHQHASWSPEVMYYGKSVHYPGETPGLRDAAGRAEAEGEHHIAGMLRGLAEFFEGRVSDKSHLVELMAPAFSFAEEHKVPLYCGEFGVIDRAPVEDALRWYRDTSEVFAEHDVSWSVWSYKDGSFGLVDRDGTVRNQDLIDMLRSGA